MGTSMTALGKRAKTTDGDMEMGTEVDGNYERRPRSAVLGIALAGYSEVVKEHAQWRNPGLKPQVEAHQSSFVEVVDGAVSAWVADECNRELGQELSP